VNVADGFYRMLSTRDVLKVCILVPHADGKAALISSPLTLHVGSVESPAVYCGGTDSLADVAKRASKTKWDPLTRNSMLKRSRMQTGILRLVSILSSLRLPVYRRYSSYSRGTSYFSVGSR
jgi:hypothetical protein